MSIKPISVAFLLADYGHDPTETAIPFQGFKKAGFAISFITDSGKTPECDQKMISGWTGSLLGAASIAKDAYAEMVKSTEWQHPLAWSDKSTSLIEYELLFLPGGHDRAIRQLLDSFRAQQLVAEFWPSIKRPNRKVCGAICHGVQLLAHTKVDGTSVLHDVTTTALVGTMESSVFWVTRLFLGDYYKTYGSGTPNVEDIVKTSLDNPVTQWKGSANTSTPLVVEDGQYNYLSGRWPGDAQSLTDRIIERVTELNAR